MFNFSNKDNREFIIINLTVEKFSYLFIYLCYRFMNFVCSVSRKFPFFLRLLCYHGPYFCRI